MPLARPLLQLCALLLIVFAATAAHAAAPPYELNEVKITITHTPGIGTRSAQNKTCRESGGVLLPMVTNAVYLETVSQMTSSGFNFAFGHMGASTMLSPATCTTSKATLDCTWFWDEGRYAGEGNALEFYKGNRNGNILTNARMVGNLVSNYWGAHADATQFPGSFMERYGVAARKAGALGWQDNGESWWTYGNWDASWYHTFCGIAQSTSPPSTPDPSGETAGLSVGVIVGIAAGGAVVVGVIIALVVCLACNGCCCSAGSTAVADTASQRGDMSRANSFRSRHSGYGDFDNRSFHDGAAGKDGYSRHCSFHGGAGAAEAERRQNDYEMASVAGSHYTQAAPGAYGSWAPPPRAASQVMMPVPPLVMMPVQPQVMIQPQPLMPMHGNWQMWEAPRDGGGSPREPPAAEMQRRASSVSSLRRNVTNAHNTGAADGASF